MSESRTCLVHHVDESLCVVPNEAMDHVAFIFTREDRLGQGGEFVQSECASD